MSLTFNILAILLMFVNIMYVVHVFISLKRSQSKNSALLRKLNWIGHAYITLLLVFLIGYIVITIMSMKDDGLTSIIISQILFWGAVFVFISIYVFNALFQQISEEMTYEISDLKISLNNYIKHMPGGVHHCQVDPELKVTYVSPGFTDITGYKFDDINRISNGKYTGIIMEEDQQRFVDAIYQLMDTKTEVTVTYRVLKPEGTVIWVSDSMNIIKDSRGNRHIFAVVLDITDEMEKASKDALTGLLNKGAFHTLSKEYMDLHADSFVGLFMIDLNDFKSVNDIYGHQIGDIILKKVADYLTTIFSNYDTLIGRVGGDEFMVLVKGIREEEMVDLKSNLVSNFHITLEEIADFPVISGSVGYTYCSCKSDFDTIYQSADESMYKEKRMIKEF